MHLNVTACGVFHISTNPISQYFLTSSFSKKKNRPQKHTVFPLKHLGTVVFHITQIEVNIAFVGDHFQSEIWCSPAHLQQQNDVFGKSTKEMSRVINDNVT